MKTYRSLIVLSLAVSACSFEKNQVQDISAPAPGSFIRFANFGVSSPGVNFYANDQKLTAISSTNCVSSTNPLCATTGIESTTGTVTGAFATSSNGYYGSVAPGQYTLTARIAATVDNNLIISSVPGTLADGKYYTYYISGIYNTTAKTDEAFLVEDPLPPFDYVNANVRFVNAISNAAPMTLYAKPTTATTEIAIGGLVPYKAGGAFVALPAGSYDLNTRVSGSATNAISRAAVTFAAGRVYTITSRGDITVVSTTLATRPQLDNTTNR